MIHFYKKWQQWFLPYTCLLCHYPSEREQDLCQACHDAFPFIISACMRCAKKLADTSLTLICGDCLQSPPAFHKTFALSFYQPPISTLILHLKFSGALINARILGELTAEKILRQWYHTLPLPEVIIPVPLHPNRLKERGFNQAIEIARPIAKKLNLPIYTKAKRIRSTAAQATLPANQRKANIKNAFSVEDFFHGKHVAILDDVITTGHTVMEFSKTLKRAGAAIIDVWCCARP